MTAQQHGTHRLAPDQWFNFDEAFMRTAIGYAQVARNLGQAPFGCVIVDPFGDPVAIGLGSGTPSDPTRHSEMDAIRSACAHAGDSLHGHTIYSTHEPCLMCTGAIMHAKIPRVVWGSSRADMPDKFRPYPSGQDRWKDSSLERLVYPGVLADECVALWQGVLL